MATPPFKITQGIRDTFQAGIEALITQLGVPCKMIFDGRKLPCPNCTFDPVRMASGGVAVSGGPIPFTRPPCPYCQGTGYDPATLEVSEVRTFGVSRDLKPSAVYPPGTLTRPVTLASIKGVVDDLPLVQQAKIFVIDYLNSRHTGERYFKVAEPIFTGNIVSGHFFVCYLQREE